jgi:hypothetical protein
MLRIRKGLLTLAVLAAVVAFAAGSPARADYAYEVFDDGVGGGIITQSGPAFNTGTLTTTHFQLVIGSSTTSQSPVSTVLSSNLTANLLSTASAGTHTITLELVSQNIAQPAGGTLGVSTTGSISFSNSLNGDGGTVQAWGQNTPSGVFNTGATGGQQSATVPTGASTSATMPIAAFTFTRTGNYSLAQTLSLSLSNTSNNESGLVQGTSTITAVPG